jgi:hypothetical protein
VRMTRRVKPVVDIRLQPVWDSTRDDAQSLTQMPILLVTVDSR